MKICCKKISVFISVLLLLLLFTVCVMAETATDTSSVPSTTEPVSSNVVTSKQDNTNPSSNGQTTSNVDSSLVESGEETSSATSNLSSYSNSSAVGDESNTSGNNSEVSSSSSSYSSNVGNVNNYSSNSTVSNGTSSKKNSYQGNVGGYVNDEADVSGWGNGEEETSSLTSAGTTEKGESKQITNYSTLLWVLIWIPVLFIIASIGALVYVNRKAFIEGEGPIFGGDKSKNDDKNDLFSDRPQRKKTNKRNTKYRPRD